MSNTTPSPEEDDWVFQGFSNPNTTAVPDEFFDFLAPRLKEAELRVALYIIRRTFGFKKASDEISLRQMVEGITTRAGKVLDYGTGLSKPSVIKAVKSLVERGVVVAKANQSRERGFEATTYRLNVLPPSVGQVPLLTKFTSPSKLKQHALVNEVNPQHTVEQETVEQEIKPFEASKHRSVSSLENEGSLGSSDQIGAPGGFSTPGDVLRSRGQSVQAHAQESPPRSAAPAAEAPSQPAEREAPDGNPRENRPETASEDWQRIQFHIDEFRRDLGDKATLRASTTRAYNLYVRSGVSIGVFVERLFQARTITQEHTASITSQGEDAAYKMKRKTKVPYFFSVLEDLLDLLPPEERARRDRLRAQAVKRVEAAKRGEQQTPKRKGEGDQGDNGRRSGPGRDSDGPYAAYIEH